MINMNNNNETRAPPIQLFFLSFFCFLQCFFLWFHCFCCRKLELTKSSRVDRSQFAEKLKQTQKNSGFFCIFVCAFLRSIVYFPSLTLSARQKPHQIIRESASHIHVARFTVRLFGNHFFILLLLLQLRRRLIQFVNK